MSASEMFGFTPESWKRARREASCAIGRAGRNDELVTYSDLLKTVSAVPLDPFGGPMNRLLDQISKEEDAAGRGIITALVILKDERVSGEGF